MKLFAVLACVFLLPRGTATVTELERSYERAYAEAQQKASDSHALAASRADWAERRAQCSSERCVATRYRMQIAELQTRYSLVKSHGPVRLSCKDDPRLETRVTFYETDLPTVIVQRGGESRLMYGAPWGSGTQYRDGDKSFFWHHDEARIAWTTRPVTCEPRP